MALISHENGKIIPLKYKYYCQTLILIVLFDFELHKKHMTKTIHLLILAEFDCYPLYINKNVFSTS